MKHKLIRIVMLLLMISTVTIAFSQNQSANTTTIIIVRHAEKQAGNDPALTEVGMDRAQNLPSLFPGVKPDEIFTTPYVRTKQTITPWAKIAGVEIKEYNAQKLPDFAAYLKKLAGKTVLVAGHSNTNPQLVNLLINQDKYKQLDDMDYETKYIVTINDGKATVKLMK